MKEISFPSLFSLQGYIRPRDILVVGCGGTGAYTISHLARFISALDNPPHLCIADGDSVEEKNLLRQHFISRDIGKNKAEVLGERYSAAFGIPISIITKDIEKSSDFSHNLRNRDALIIGCVDNNASRKVIYDYCLSRSASEYMTFWIDSGNEEVNGQVICGFFKSKYARYYNVKNNSMAFDVNTQIINSRMSGLFNMPASVEVYPELLEEDSKFNSDLSCAERAISAPQHMMINVTAATMIMNYVQAILSNEPLTSHGVEFSIKNAFTARLNTKENLAAATKRKI